VYIAEASSQTSIDHFNRIGQILGSIIIIVIKFFFPQSDIPITLLSCPSPSLGPGACLIER
jgi:hypothetical protein